MQNHNSKYKSDLQARCYRFALDIISLTNDLPNKRSAWVMADQLIRSSTSVGANLVEGRASSSRLEFKKFYEISLKSANESKYWLELLRDADLTGAEKISPLLAEITEIANMLAKGVLRLKGKL